MHRLIPVWCAWRGAVIREVEVGHHPRREGRSHYGLGRTFKVLLDLLTAKFFLSFLGSPSHALGGAGLLLMGGGFLSGTLAIIDKLGGNHWPAFRVPLMILSVFLGLLGAQLSPWAFWPKSSCASITKTAAKKFTVSRAIYNAPSVNFWRVARNRSTERSRPRTSNIWKRPGTLGAPRDRHPHRVEHRGVLHPAPRGQRLGRLFGGLRREVRQRRVGFDRSLQDVRHIGLFQDLLHRSRSYSTSDLNKKSIKRGTSVSNFTFSCSNATAASISPAPVLFPPLQETGLFNERHSAVHQFTHRAFSGCTRRFIQINLFGSKMAGFCRNARW
jgi:hypothetical protein